MFARSLHRARSVPSVALSALRISSAPNGEVIKKYERVRLRRRVKIDDAAFAEEMERAAYDPERDGLPTWWKSENWERRLKDILAVRGRVKTEKEAQSRMRNEYELKIQEAEYKKRLDALKKEVAALEAESAQPKKKTAGSHVAEEMKKATILEEPPGGV